MRVRVLKTFRLSDIVGHKTEIVMLDDKQIKFNLLNEVSIQDFTSQKGLRRLPKATQNAIIAGLKTTDILDSEEKENLGIFVGISLSYVEHALQFVSEAYESSPRLVSPLMFPNTVLNSISGWVSIVLGSRELNTTINLGNSSGINALKTAYEYVELGIVKYALVVVTEEITKSVVESDLTSSSEYTEETIGILIGNNEEGYEIESSYSRYTERRNFEDSFSKLVEENPTYQIYGFLENHESKNKCNVVMSKEANRLSCNSLNMLYDLLEQNIQKFIIVEESKSSIYSYLKLKRSGHE